MFCQQSRGGHNLTSLAIAALGNVDLAPSLLQRVRAVGREPFDGRDVGVHGGGNRREARAHGLTAKMHSARAALADSTAVFGSVEAEHIAKHPEKGRIARYIYRRRVS